MNSRPRSLPPNQYIYSVRIELVELPPVDQWAYQVHKLKFMTIIHGGKQLFILQKVELLTTTDKQPQQLPSSSSSSSSRTA